MTDEVLGGPYRKVSQLEHRLLTEAGIPGEWAEGIGYIIYDNEARRQYKDRFDRINASNRVDALIAIEDKIESLLNDVRALR